MLILYFTLLNSFIYTSTSNFVSPYNYCSFNTFEFKKDRTIPLRGGNNHSRELSVHQVHLLHRHGSRIPNAQTSKNCFTTLLNENIDWNCLSDIFLGTPFFPENNMSISLPSYYMFSKNYDANKNRNYFNGNCMRGQLSSDALEQMKTLANILYTSYFTSSSPLFTYDKFLINPDLLYFRSTDKQRSIHSGSILISSLIDLLSKEYSYFRNEEKYNLKYDKFIEVNYTKNNSLFYPKFYNDFSINSIASQLQLNKQINLPFPIKVHLVDLDNDELRKNKITCPEAETIAKRALNSYSLKQFFLNNQLIYKFMKEKTLISFDHFYDSHLLDCYTSLLCNGYENLLPIDLQVPINTTKENLGVQFYKTYFEEYLNIYSWNKSQLARCIIKDFFKTFFGAFNIPTYFSNNYTSYPFSNSNTQQSNYSNLIQPPKLLIYSAHDSSIFSFLLALNNKNINNWPSIASALLFEIYIDNNNQSFFRFIYNGEDLTYNWNKCNTSITFKEEGVCPISFIFDEIEWINYHCMESFLSPIHGTIHLNVTLILVFIFLIFLLFKFMYISKIKKYFQRNINKYNKC